VKILGIKKQKTLALSVGKYWIRCGVQFWLMIFISYSIFFSVTEDVMGDAIRLGGMIASNSPVAVVGTKRSLVYSRDHTVAEGLQHIANHNALALMTSDLPTAFMAASKKEQPRFSSMPIFSRL
jgi:hypothetical protein